MGNANKKVIKKMLSSAVPNKVVSYADYVKTKRTGYTFKLYAMKLEEAMLEAKVITKEDLLDVWAKVEQEAKEKFASVVKD